MREAVTRRGTTGGALSENDRPKIKVKQVKNEAEHDDVQGKEEMQQITSWLGSALGALRIAHSEHGGHTRLTLSSFRTRPVYHRQLVIVLLV